MTKRCTDGGWRTPGCATGSIRWTVSLPAIDFETDRRFQILVESSLSRVTRTVIAVMPTSEAALEGGTFEIVAAVRAKSLGIRYVRLCRCRGGEPVRQRLDEAETKWEMLPKERRE